MPINGFTIGSDIRISLKRPNGSNLIINQVLDFQMKSEATHIMPVLMNGNVTPFIFPKGYTGTLKYQRKDPNVEIAWAEYEAAYYNGVNLLPNSITQTITNPNGSVSEGIWTQLFFMLDTQNMWKGAEVAIGEITIIAGKYEITTRGS